MAYVPGQIKWEANKRINVIQGALKLAVDSLHKIEMKVFIVNTKRPAVLKYVSLLVPYSCVINGGKNCQYCHIV